MKHWIEKHGYWMKIPVMLNLGMLFIVAGVTKLFYQSDSFTTAPFLETIPGALSLYAALPYIEIVIGLLLISGLMVKFAAACAAALITIFLASTLYLVSTGHGLDLCGCFGMAGRLNYIGAFGIDVAMVLMVTVILICQRGSYFNMTPWFLDETKITVEQRA